MQSFPQVSDALIHHRHLGVPLVQQLLVLGQLAALLQVVAVASLKHTPGKTHCYMIPMVKTTAFLKVWIIIYLQLLVEFPQLQRGGAREG